MKITSAEVVKAPIIKKDDNGDPEYKGSFKAGIRVHLDCGTSVYHNFKNGSFKTTYPQVQIYQYGRLATDELGRPVLSKLQTSRCRNLSVFTKEHSKTFCQLVLQGMKEALEALGDK